jgi:hypothetical protein
MDYINLNYIQLNHVLERYDWDRFTFQRARRQSSFTSPPHQFMVGLVLLCLGRNFTHKVDCQL